MATDLSDRGEAEVEDLVHHGVKGQRWGVIRKKASAGRRATVKALQKSGRFTANATKTTIKTARTGASKVQKAKQAHDQRVAGKKQAKADAKARKKFANRGYKKISDTELQSRIKRLEQEKRYRELKADRHNIKLLRRCSPLVRTIKSHGGISGEYKFCSIKSAVTSSSVTPEAMIRLTALTISC